MPGRGRGRQVITSKEYTGPLRRPGEKPATTSTSQDGGKYSSSAPSESEKGERVLYYFPQLNLEIWLNNIYKQILYGTRLKASIHCLNLDLLIIQFGSFIFLDLLIILYAIWSVVTVFSLGSYITFKFEFYPDQTVAEYKLKLIIIQMRLSQQVILNFAFVS